MYTPAASKTYLELFCAADLFARFCGLARSALDEIQKRADGDARRAFRAEGLGLVAASCARDVEVRPRDSVGELLDEGGGGNRPGLASADVFDVGDVRLDLLRVFLVEGKLPVFLTDFPARFDHFVNQFLISAEYARVHIAECD